MTSDEIPEEEGYRLTSEKPHEILASIRRKDPEYVEYVILFRKTAKIGNKPSKKPHLFRKTGQIGNKPRAPTTRTRGYGIGHPEEW